MTSGEYWEKRAIERALRLERGTLPYIRKLASLYARAYRSLREDLDRLFERYVETGDFSPEEAAAYLREPVTPKERKILEDALKGITDEDERRKAVARINSASYRARMDRLRAMQERIRIECAKTAPDVIDTIRQAMERSGREAYYRTIFDNSKAAGVQLPFTDLSLERLEGVINQKIEGKSFSSRVWGNTNAVAQLLTDTLKENVATGRSWRRSVSDMRELLGVDYLGGATYAATRILRTETARVNNELSAEANVENGFDRYRYIAMLDSKTTEACRDHDGGIDPDTKKPYTYKNKKLGVNFPPLHPNCRSTTCAWVSEELLAKITRSAKDENGNVYQIPGNMTYREWEKGRNEGKINSWIKQTGGYTREETFAEREERREKEADKEYDLIRKQDDIAAIATHTGFSAEEILQIKNHVFFDNHVLYDGEIGRCFPSYDMAVAWQRLARGEGIDRDILLLRHELLEDQYEKQYNSDLEAAHHYSDSVYGWYDRMRAETNGEGEPDGLLHFSRKKQ